MSIKIAEIASRSGCFGGLVDAPPEPAEGISVHNATIETRRLEQWDVDFFCG
jgi:hypothetical protein